MFYFLIYARFADLRPLRVVVSLCAGINVVKFKRNPAPFKQPTYVADGAPAFRLPKADCSFRPFLERFNAAVKDQQAERPGDPITVLDFLEHEFCPDGRTLLSQLLQDGDPVLRADQPARGYPRAITTIPEDAMQEDDDAVIDSRVAVTWDGGEVYLGTVLARNASGEYKIEYDDGDVCWEKIPGVGIEVLPGRRDEDEEEEEEKEEEEQQQEDED